MGRPSRRELLAGVGSVIPLAAAGCQSIDPSGPSTEPGTSPTASPGPTDPSPTPSISPCSALDRSSESPTPCPDVEITYVSDEPRTRTRTATGNRTTVPGAAGDNLVVRVRIGGDADRTLVGCIESVDEGRQPITRTLEPRDEAYRLEFGPFSHHGILEAVVWVESCGNRTYWP